MKGGGQLPPLFVCMNGHARLIPTADLMSINDKLFRS